MNTNLTNAAAFLGEHHLKEVILGLLIASGALLFDSVTKNWQLVININGKSSELVKLSRKFSKI